MISIKIFRRVFGIQICLMNRVPKYVFKNEVIVYFAFSQPEFEKNAQNSKDTPKQTNYGYVSVTKIYFFCDKHCTI